MSNRLTLSEAIVRAAGTGKDPAIIDILEAVTGATIPSGTQQAHIANASVAHSLNATFSNTEVQNALDALGAVINAILLVIEEFKQTATA